MKKRTFGETVTAAPVFGEDEVGSSIVARLAQAVKRQQVDHQQVVAPPLRQPGWPDASTQPWGVLAPLPQPPQQQQFEPHRQLSPPSWQESQQQQHHQQQSAAATHPDHADGCATATVTLTTSAANKAAAQAPPAPDGGVGADRLLAETQAQLEQRQEDAAAQAGSKSLSEGHQQQHDVHRPPPRMACTPLQELQLLLPAVHAEYKSEMLLMLRACKLASRATRVSTRIGTTLLLDPTQRDQLQRQVLANCNAKHLAVTTAFRQAAKAVEDAAVAAQCSGFLGIKQQQQQQTQPAAAGPGALVANEVQQGAAAEGSTLMSQVWRSLQHLRSVYQQELVACTSALFAISKGFGQTYALSPAASTAIKTALAAAQHQHTRVEQLWQDLVLAAGGAV